MIWIDVMLKDAALKSLQIEPSMVGELACRIQERGSEWIHTKDKSFEVVGFVVKGRQTGKRILVLGTAEDEETK